MLFISYRLSPKLLPSEASVWRTCKRMERDGVVVSKSVLDGLMNGNLTYKDKKVYKLCKCCLDYKELTDFYDNTKSLTGKTQTCKVCTRAKTRIRRHGIVSKIESFEDLELTQYPSYEIGEKGRMILERGGNSGNVTGQKITKE